jgi:electron transport complex protein RnfD
MDSEKQNSTKKEEMKTPSRKNFILSSPPHLSAKNNVPKIMWSVVVSLVPAVVFSIFYFGLQSLLIIAVSIIFAVATEGLINIMRKREQTISDGSAVVSGLLLALTLPPSLSLGFVALGAVFAIGIGKQIFGGLGYNIFNPALLGRAFLQASFPVRMTTWTPPRTLDALTTATPLGAFKFEGITTPHFQLLIGNVGGCIGETCAIALLVGGAFLIVKKYANWRIPLSYISTVFIFSGIFWLINPLQYADPLFHVLSGGLLLGAFFMATDMVTSPITPKGCWIFGIGAGIVLVIIRLFGGLPEGCMYSILLMNAFTPLINRFTHPKLFGKVKNE